MHRSLVKRAEVIEREVQTCLSIAIIYQRAHAFIVILEVWIGDFNFFDLINKGYQFKRLKKFAFLSLLVLCFLSNCQTLLDVFEEDARQSQSR